MGLLKACKQLKFKAISAGKPTYWQTNENKTPDLSDFFMYINITSNYMKIEETWYMNPPFF